jgi:hypothetical protein
MCCFPRCSMFSLMSLYFAYRRNVVVAERYMPALDE